MAKVEDYQIISFTSHYKVTSEVRGLLNKGYHPWGELRVTINNNASAPIFSQAMVKYNSIWPDE